MTRTQMPPDEEIVRSAQLGSMEAFTCLYERYLPVVLRRVNYMIPSVDVEDVTQDIFIATMRSLKNFRGDSQFCTWLRTIVNREIADYYRRRNPRPQTANIDIDSLEAERMPELTTKSPVPAIDNDLLVQQALRCLPDRYREILLLRFLEDLQFNQIASQLGLSLEATKSLFRRAMAALEKELEGANG